MKNVEELPVWITPKQVISLASEHGSPLYVYSKATLEAKAKQLLSTPAPFGLTVRFAMKANPHKGVLSALRSFGLHIDASSGFEAEKAIEAGFEPSEILLTSQQLPKNLKELVEQGVQFNATSLHQLETYCTLFPGRDVSVRINPAIGSGINNRLTTGGVNSSFGIWHEYIPKMKEIVAQAGCKIVRLHTHIGTGTDPNKWAEAEEISLKLIEQFPDATTLNLGGGFKVAYMSTDQPANVREIGERLSSKLSEFAERTGRKLKLEIEPGRFITAEAGILITKVIDKTDTGEDGHIFLRVDTGMNDFIRPGMYGALHPLISVGSDGELPKEIGKFVVVGHNCESSDIFTPYPKDPEGLQPRLMGNAEIGDFIVITGTGAYGASFATHGYNGYPSAKELLI